MLWRLKITEYHFFPQNNCIYSHYVLFQDSENRVSANRDWTGMSNSSFDQFVVTSIQMAPPVLSFKHRSRPSDHSRLHKYLNVLNWASVNALFHITRSTVPVQEIGMRRIPSPHPNPTVFQKSEMRRILKIRSRRIQNFGFGPTQMLFS